MSYFNTKDTKDTKGVRELTHFVRRSGEPTRLFDERTAKTTNGEQRLSEPSATLTNDCPGSGSVLGVESVVMKRVALLLMLALAAPAVAQTPPKIEDRKSVV